MHPMNQPPDKSVKQPPSRKLFSASVAGGVGSLLTLAFFLLESRPELTQLLVERVLIAWGPQFVLALLLFVFLFLLADRYAPRLITAQSETAVALDSLARAVRQSVERENAFQREQDVLLNHVARQVESLRKLIDQHHRTVTTHLARLDTAPEKTSPPAK